MILQISLLFGQLSRGGALNVMYEWTLTSECQALYYIPRRNRL